MSLILHNHPPNPLHTNFHIKKLNFPAKFDLKFTRRKVHRNVDRGVDRRDDRRIVFVTQAKAAYVEGEDVNVNVNVDGVSEKLLKLVKLVTEVLPGGKWWRFSEQVEIGQIAKPVTLVRALRRMWELISTDRWVIFAAFTALILTAVLFAYTIFG